MVFVLAWLLKNAVKAATAGTVAYVTIQQGVWSDSQTSEKTFQMVTNTVMPGTVQSAEKIPSKEVMSRTAADYWNALVMSAFDGASAAPSATIDTMSTAMNKLRSSASSF